MIILVLIGYFIIIRIREYIIMVIYQMLYNS